ncbi:hypothetical protein Cci01nite_50340 [Catellatospora citrea]|uniref:Uncharacterized protein n=1 Tax=Catellatospora citrea TaxID=53366 RepID=A0A8J3P0X1_9ACTN|nr:hypothetical protein Cci01nite_50340 [Catellatospora citrea]
MANVIAISCDLSPSSATKITPKLIARAARKPSTASSRDMFTGWKTRATTSTRHGLPESKVSLTWPKPGRVAGTAGAGQYVDHHVRELLPFALPTLAQRTPLATA